MSLISVTEIDDLVRQVQSCYPEADEALLRRAYAFSAKAHEGQTRRSGEPYLQHPVAVAGILTFLKLDVTAIVAGLLHDTLEDTVATQEELQTHFGHEVAHLVEGVTKIGQIPFRTYEEKQAENFRKMLLSMADDIRVVFIKLADRLHNMRTLGHLPEDKQKQIAQETLEIYAPLANRLGMSWLKQELEDLCFQYLKTEAYSLLKLRVAQRDEERQVSVQSIIQETVDALAKAGLPGHVVGRPKHLYSIHQKMQSQGITFEEVHDLVAIRIITSTKSNCYTILGLVHSLWPPVPGRFKDYIATPRTNLYQSLHTTVLGPQGDHVEFQIRTEEMHRLAEYGVAAHWRYKEQVKVDERDEKVFSWLRQFVEWHKDLSDNRQFMDSVKLDLFHLDVFHDVVFAFTPRGRSEGVAAWFHAGRLCLCDSHASGRSLRRGESEWKDRPSSTGARQRRYRGNSDFADPGPEERVVEVRSDVPGESENQTFLERRRAKAGVGIGASITGARVSSSSCPVRAVVTIGPSVRSRRRARL